MHTIERLPPTSEIVVFPSEDALNEHLALNPCVRHVARVIRQSNARGATVALLATYPSQEEAAHAWRTGVLQDAAARREYLRTAPRSPTQQI